MNDYSVTKYADDISDKWNHAGDFANTKQKAGKDKRLASKSERKANRAFREARKNRHN